MASEITSESSTSSSTNPFPSSAAVLHAHYYITIKLEPRNYLYWHTLIHPFLSIQSLLGFVDGSSPSPPIHTTIADNTSTKVNPEVVVWKRNDNHVKTIILSSLTEECFPVIVGKKTSVEIWDALATAYANPSESRILQLHEELHECRQKESSISNYLGRTKVIAHNLAAAGRPLSQQDFLSYIFWGHRPEFQNVSTTLRGRKEPISFEDLQLLLTQEYITRSQKESTLNPLALFSSTGASSAASGGGLIASTPPSAALGGLN